jgi:large subunit ribosomal protein L9
MKVLLTGDVKKLGWLGDVVEVADGYARNYLFPQRLAKMATDNNIKTIAKAKAKHAEERRLLHAQLEKVVHAVEGAEVVIAAAANEQGHLFGSVFRHDIANNLRSQGFEVRDDDIAVYEHIKEVGSYKIKLEFMDDLTATINLVVVPEGADIEEFKAALKEAARKHEEKAEVVEPEPEKTEEPKEESKEKPQQ